jgi:hypothetical protein
MESSKISAWEGTAIDHFLMSGDPTPPDIPQADEEETDAKNNQQSEIDWHGHRIPNTEGSVEDISAVGRRKHIRKRPEKNRQILNREEKPTQTYHWETKKIGKGLGFEYFPDRNCDEQSQEGGSDRKKKNGGNHSAPDDLRKIGQKCRKDDRNSGVAAPNRIAPEVLANIRSSKGLGDSNFYTWGIPSFPYVLMTTKVTSSAKLYPF